MKELTFTQQQIFEIYKCSYSIAESRGKKRQHLINSIVIQSLKNNSQYDGCEFLTETRIKDICWGKYFSVDIEVRKNNQLVEIILIKAPASNINQNSVNALNSKAGEFMRLLPLTRNGVKITFINFQPNVSPFFKRDGSIKKFENNKIRNIQKVKDYDFKNLSDIIITFDIEGIKNCKNREDVKRIFSINDVIRNIKPNIDYEQEKK